MRARSLAVLTIFCSTALTSATEFDLNEDQLQDVYPGEAYSPYAGRSFPERPLWGDTHLHTGQSMDAGGFGARLTQEECLALCTR